jgi:WhiB family redox-sensing transcriptional regulator
VRDVSKSFMEPVVGKQAACSTVEDPEIFFPSYAEGGEFTVAMAKKVCRSCYLINECLEFALHTGDQWGILGGTTPAERTSIKRSLTWREAA